MADDRRGMYDGFSDKCAHSVEWLEVAKNFLKLAFTGDHCVAKCPCKRCQNRRMLFEYEMCYHIAKHRFMSNYLAWHQHGEVQSKSDGSNNEDRMDDMISSSMQFFQFYTNIV
jgi:hypothetical protein